jgi:chorismate dehydratase
MNPAPLMWDFEHAPRNSELLLRYQLHYTLPSRCADELIAGRADLGLIPIAALTPELAVVPGSTIASLDRVRSIQLIVKKPHTLGSIRTLAADNASRSSRAYAELILRRFYSNSPHFVTQSANPVAMLEQADAALLIGDPALLALEARDEIERAVGPCEWFDIAHEWNTLTGLPWVAAVWATRPEAIAEGRIGAAQLIDDLTQSRDQGLAHIEDLVTEWTSRIALSPETIRHYFTQNIHYTLTPECAEAISLFRSYAAEEGILPPLPSPRFL